MPAAQFTWAKVPSWILDSMARQYEDDDPDGIVEYLEGYYGPVPDEEFVREWFGWMLESWLPGDRTSRHRVVAEMAGPTAGSQREQTDFLLTKSNAKRFRGVLLTEFLAVSGETDEHQFFDETMIIELPPPGSPLVRLGELERIGHANVTLGELEQRLWDAANALRGPVDPADFERQPRLAGCRPFGPSSDTRANSLALWSW